MFTPLSALITSYVLTAGIAGIAAVTLWQPLRILLGELCETEQRSRFWAIWSTVMMIGAPMLLVSMRTVSTDPTGLVQGTIAFALTGILIALAGMGLAVYSRAPAPVA